jgi:predicted PurR-regulated permease PerM
VRDGASSTGAIELLDRRTTRILITILTFAAVLAILYVARAVLILFAFAILLAYLINPVVRFLQQHSLLFKNLRGPHVAEAYLAFLILAVFLIHTFAPDIHRHPTRPIEVVQTLSEKVSSGEIADDLGRNFGWSEAQTARARTFIQTHKSEIDSVRKTAVQFVSVALTGIVVIPILALFFLSDGEKLAQQVVRLVSTPENLDSIRSLVAELDATLQHYIRAKVILGLLSMLYSSVAMLLLGFSNAILFGLVAGILEFIPVAGWMMAAGTILTVGFMTHAHWIWMLVLLVLWRVVMDYGIGPRVMGHELELHPLLAIFTMMIGGAVGGIVGIYLSIPLVAAARVIWRRLIAAAASPATNSPSFEANRKAPVRSVITVS